MTVEALLTVLTILLAVLALIPSERAHDLGIRLGAAVRTVGTASGVLIVYWAFLEQIHALPGIRSVDRPISWVINWNPANSSLLIVLIATAVAWLSYRRRLPVSRLPALTSTIRDALARRRYSEAVHLLETHLSSIGRALSGSYWQARLRSRVFPTLGEQWMEAQRAVANAPDRASRGDAEPQSLEHDPAPLTPLLIALPEVPEPTALGRSLAARAERPREAAEDLIRAISLAPRLIREIASANPYLGLRLMQLESTWLFREFAEGYARALIEDADSVYYRELRRAENIDADGTLIVDPQEQPLLTALCADAARPSGPRLLYTFLDSGIDPLRSEGPNELRAILNAPNADYSERGRWTSPPFATIYLLAVVGPRVAVDPAAPLLNLYVLSTLVGHVLRRLEPGEEVDLSREWPTPSHYLIYEAVSLLCDLVRVLKERPDAVRRVVEAHAEDREPLSLPAHAIDVLGRVMYSSLRSDRLDTRYKAYLLEVWWRVYSDKYAGDWQYSVDVREALIRGGGRMTGAGDLAHFDALLEAIEHVDPVIRYGSSAKRLTAGLEAARQEQRASE